MILPKSCPQCGSNRVDIDYGPEFNLFQDDEVLVGFLCNNCLHSWAQEYKLVPVEGTESKEIDTHDVREA